MKNKTIWSNRFKNKTSQSFQKIGSSVHIDKRLYEQDIAASIIHAQMLMRQKIIKSEDGNKIISGLKKIKAQIVEFAERIGVRFGVGHERFCFSSLLTSALSAAGFTGL